MKDQKQKWFLIVVFLLMIYAVGILQAAIEWSEGDRPFIVELFTQKPTQANLRSFESELEKSSYVSQALQPAMRYFQFSVLKETGDKALMGRDGWFFYRPGAQYLIEPWPSRTGTVDENLEIVTAVVDFRDQLKARGIELLVVPAPGKASVYPEMLAARASTSVEPVYAHTIKVLEELKKAGIEFVDLFEAFTQSKTESSEYYLAQDTHWSTEGMRLAAKLTAQRLIELGWIERGNSQYELKPVTFSRYGDVLRMMDIPRIEQFYSPEELQCMQVVNGGNGELRKDDPESDILVLGDSFLRIYERDEPKVAGFVSHLAYELQTPIASIISDGGASTLVRQELKRKSELLAGKKVVVWEFVERDIRFGLEGWKKVPLP